MGSASALVIDGERLVIASMGDYKAVLCEDGIAHQISCDRHQTDQRWPRKLIPGNLSCKPDNKKPKNPKTISIVI